MGVSNGSRAPPHGSSLPIETAQRVNPSRAGVWVRRIAPGALSAQSLENGTSTQRAQYGISGAHLVRRSISRGERPLMRRNPEPHEVLKFGKHSREEKLGNEFILTGISKFGKNGKNFPK